MLNDDNDEARRAVEVCFRTRKTLVNPIIDWTDDEVWEFIHKYNVPYCKLYDEGYKRLGCIGCPMGSTENRIKELDKNPKYKEQYMRCFDKMYQNRVERGLKSRLAWNSGEDMFNWWMRLGNEPIEQLSLLMEEEMEDT